MHQQNENMQTAAHVFLFNKDCPQKICKPWITSALFFHHHILYDKLPNPKLTSQKLKPHMTCSETKGHVLMYQNKIFCNEPGNIQTAPTDYHST